MMIRPVEPVQLDLFRDYLEGLRRDDALLVLRRLAVSAGLPHDWTEAFLTRKSRFFSLLGAPERADTPEFLVWATQTVAETDRDYHQSVLAELTERTMKLESERNELRRTIAFFVAFVLLGFACWGCWEVLSAFERRLPRFMRAVEPVITLAATFAFLLIAPLSKWLEKMLWRTSRS